jgi:hypothetical protein
VPLHYGVHVPRTGYEVTRVLKIAWEATGRVCSKLLAPFLPELIDSLERTSHR